MTRRNLQITIVSSILFLVFVLFAFRTAPVFSQSIPAGREAAGRFGAMRIPLFKGSLVLFESKGIVHG